MKRKTTKEFIIDAKKVHGEKYDYSLVEYVNSTTNVKIICYKHGIFEQLPNNHLHQHGCQTCVGLKKNTIETFIEKSNKMHNNKYDYSLVKYINIHTPVKILCPVHGVFEQKPKIHLNKKGCYQCGNEILRKTTEQFIKDTKIIHGDKYDYSLSKYITSKDNIKIICKEHGIFKQTPSNHLLNHGCPMCNESKGEMKITKILKSYNILHKKQKSFPKCKYKQILHFDFYLPDYNLCIEFDGEQHFKIKKYWGGEKEFLEQQKRDNIKTNYCKNNNINLLRIKYNENIEEKLNSILKV